MNLKQAVKAKKECPVEHGKTTEACRNCIVARPLHEHSEHPTVCELLTEIENILNE